MRRIFSVVVALGGLSLTVGSTDAMASHCGGPQFMPCPVMVAPPPPPPPPVINCRPHMIAPCPVRFAPPPVPVRVQCDPAVPTPGCRVPVIVHHSEPAPIDPMIVSTSNPMGHLRRVSLSGSPHVNIMRVHGQIPSAALSDAPSAYTGGCNPTSTQYCGQKTTAMPAPAPYIAPPLPRVDPASFRPRQYGTTSMTRGTALVPTSHVDRSHARATAALNSGRAVAQPIANGGLVPHPSMFAGSQHNTTYSSGAHTSGHSSWEQASGPTMIGTLPATQVICRRPSTPTVPAPMPAPPLCGPAMMPQYPQYHAVPTMARGPVSSRHGSPY